MFENEDERTSEGIDELLEFYAQKKNEQEALKKLLEALEVKTKKDNATKGDKH